MGGDLIRLIRPKATSTWGTTTAALGEKKKVRLVPQAKKHVREKRETRQKMKTRERHGVSEMGHKKIALGTLGTNPRL